MRILLPGDLSDNRTLSEAKRTCDAVIHSSLRPLHEGLRQTRLAEGRL